MIPGPVRNAFAGRGSSICRINGATVHSAFIWKDATGETIKEIPKDIEKFSLSALGHDDLEDLVAMYLQAELGWYVVLGTAKAFYADNRVCASGTRGASAAYLQVKAGESIAPVPAVVPPEVDRFYLFDPAPSHAKLKLAKQSRH